MAKFTGITPPEAEIGFAQQFEYKPEHIGGVLVPKVINASWLRKRRVGDLHVYAHPDLLAAPKITIGFGIPNAYVLVPDAQDGDNKFSAFSFKRKPSKVETSAQTHELFQAGAQLVLRNAPAEAEEALRQASVALSGKLFDTCVNAVMTAMEQAGFASGNAPLSSHYLPDTVLMTLLRNGLTWRGQRVEFDVVRTGYSNGLESHALKIAHAELSTFRRHRMRNLEAKSKGGSKIASMQLAFWKAIVCAFSLPFVLLGKLLGIKGEPKQARPAPGLPREAPYETVDVSVSMPSALGVLMRLIWGSHAQYRASTQRVNSDDYFQRTLKEFPQENPSFLTRLKKMVLFSRPVIWLIRKILCTQFHDIGACSERDIFNMMATHTEEAPHVYNLVLTGRGKDWTLMLSPISVFLKIIDWILSKHVLVSGYSKWVLFAGEAWKGADGVIYISGNSGTYQPTEEELDAMIAFLSAVFPHLRFAKVSRKQETAPAVAAA